MYITVKTLSYFQDMGVSELSKWSFAEKWKSDITVKGSGTQNDPILFDQTFPKRFGLENYKYHTLAKDLKFKICSFKKCKNLIFGNCDFRIIKMEDCSNIIFRNCIISSQLRMNDCSHIRFENCYIYRAFHQKTSENSYLNSTFADIRDWSGKGSTFTGNQIHLLTINLKEDTFIKRNILDHNVIAKQSYSKKGLFRLPAKYFFKKNIWVLVALYLGLFMPMLIFSINYGASPNPFATVIYITFPIVALLAFLPFLPKLVFYLKTKKK
jgi:hypothetical protein